jgi:hypothetical protein
MPVASGTSTSVTYTHTTEEVEIGRDDRSQYYWWGEIDEVRFSNIDRSDAWLRATYYTLWDDLLTYNQGAWPVYTASGTVTVDGYLTENIPVRLYRRSTGELVGSTTSNADGEFTIDSIFSEDHYLTALYTASGTNALVYDWISP